MKTLLVTAVLVLALTSTAGAEMSLTGRQAHAAARQGLRSSLGSLLYNGAGSAQVRVGHCNVRGRRGTCPSRVTGTVVDCRVRLRVLLAGSGDASRLLVWSDRVRCT